jgi:hypothetical protein
MSEFHLAFSAFAFCCSGTVAITICPLLKFSWDRIVKMFSRRIAVEYELNHERRPCLMKWLDSFAMRNFTNDAAFDDTLPVVDGVMEIGLRVPLEELRTAMQDWFQRKSYVEKGARVVVKEIP